MPPGAGMLFEPCVSYHLQLMNTFDAIVIGSGQGGTPLAKKLAGAGYKTVLIEKRLVGGTCINDGCTPTKTLIGHAAIADRVRRSEEWQVFAPGMTVDYEAIWKHKNKIVSQFREGAINGIEKTAGLELIYGEATFTGPNTVEVYLNTGGTARYYAEKIYINAGARPSIPPIPGLQGVAYLTSTTLLDLQQIPGHLLIIGGSYIALEMAQLFHRLGSRVTVIESSPQLMPKEDADVAACIKGILQQEGIAVYTNTGIERVEKHINDGIVVYFDASAVVESVSGTHLLVAAGRTPNTDRLNISSAGLVLDNKGFIQVNDNLETNVPGIFALGDVKGGPAFTHVAYNDYVVIVRNLLENKQLSIKGRITPYCMFTDPQLGRVGLSEKEAHDKGIPVTVYILPMTKVARAIEAGFTRGMMKAVVHKQTGVLLGAAIIGEQGGETITVLQMAIQAGLTWEDLRYMMFAHPLYAESINNLFMQQGQ